MREVPVRIFSLLLSAALLYSCNLNKTVDSSSSSNQQGSFQTLSPANGATNQYLYVTLKWDYTVSPAPDHYEVWMAVGGTGYPTGTPSPFYQYSSSVSPADKYFTLPVLRYGTTYLWKVIAVTASGVKTESPVWTFTTMSDPSSQSIFINGLAINLIDQKTDPAAKTVIIDFQVVDLNGSGISNKTFDFTRFQVSEDGAPFSVEPNAVFIAHADVPYTLQTVLMVDNSTSVQPQNVSILQSVGNIIAGQRPANHQFQIYSFADTWLYLGSSSVQADLQNIWNSSYKPSSVRSTDLYGAVKFGTTLWSDQYSITNINQGCMVLVTDGNDTQGSTLLADALYAVHDRLVFTVRIDDSETQPDILNAIGTGGSFALSDWSRVTDGFKNMETGVINYSQSFYTLTYTSPKRGDNDHYLSISIKDNSFGGNNSALTVKYNSSGF
jgi:hypothetical protein